MANSPNYITPVGLERLTRELTWLQQSERPKVVKEVQYAASLGDRSENAEYHYGKKRLRSIDNRMRILMGRLGNMIVVDPAAQKGDKILFGATVRIEHDDGEEKTWRIFGEDEVDIARGVLSWRSPIAQAMLGKQEGDAVTFHAPAGKREVEIVSVCFESAPAIADDWVPSPPPMRGV